MSTKLIHIAEFNHLLDGLALAACLILVCFLAVNRIKYGRMYLGRRITGCGETGTETLSMQMMSQRSRRAHDNLQRALTREFEQLQRPGEDLRNHRRPPAFDDRRQCYGRAKEMLRRGDDEAVIQQRCGLLEGELELLQGLRRFAEEHSPGEDGQTRRHTPTV